MKLKFIFTLILSALLTACATLPSRELPYNQRLAWQQRQTQLNKIKNWKLQGAIAVRMPKEALSAYMNWQQKNQYYTIHLFGPLGIGAVNITGRPGNFVLQNAQNQTFKSNSPEQLIQQELGWTLPVSNLYYWIRGLPSPTTTSTKQFDRYHHITTLNQSGWQIQYLKYTGVKGIDLPSKIFMSNPTLSLRIIINQWG